MKKFLAQAIFSALLISATLSSQAKDSSNGCGPGWYVLQKNSILSSALRSTTNASLAPTVTTGMTFGTSNCTKHSLVLREKRGLHFATENYYDLMAETAKGQGEYLRAYSQTLGCPRDVHGAFAEGMQENFHRIFPAPSANGEPTSVHPQRVLLETFKVILSRPQLVQSCSLT